jgi:enoyl-CoA hydratase
VISSTGRHFSAGMALEAFGGAIAMDDSSAEGRSAIYDLLTGMQATFTKLETLRIPVIAAIQGGCIGGAVDMVTACCVRYATADAFFCIQEINIGMVADVGHVAAPAQAAAHGRGQGAGLHRAAPGRARALALGLVNEVFDTPEAMLAARAAGAAEIAAKPPVAIWGTKQAIHYARDHRWKTRCVRWAGCRVRSGATRMCARPSPR